MMMIIVIIIILIILTHNSKDKMAHFTYIEKETKRITKLLKATSINVAFKI
jgi:hypothetical protein